MRWLANQGYLLMVITAVAWAGNALVARGVHETIPPIGLAFWRWTAALPIFIAIAWPHLRRDIPVALANWKPVVALAILSITVYNTFIYFGLEHTSAINSYLINTARPVMIVLMSLFFLRVPVTLVQAIGLVIAFVGTCVIIFRGDLGVLRTLELNPGDLWIVVATTCWALYTVFLYKRPKIHGASFLAMTAAIGLVFLFPFYLWEAIYVEPVPVTWETVEAVGFLSVVASGIAYMSYNRSVEVLGANRAALTSYLIPVVGTGLAIWLLDESFHVFHAVGIVLLLGGTVLATRTRAKAA